MVEYSVGFLHSDNEIVLIEKNRPDWQKGLLNGVGGHIEKDETPKQCMQREFWEETGVLIPLKDWKHFLTLEGDYARIYVYAAEAGSELLYKTRTLTDEKVGVYSLWKTSMINTVPNLNWIIPMMLQRDKYYPTVVKFYGDS